MSADTCMLVDNHCASVQYVFTSTYVWYMLVKHFTYSHIHVYRICLSDKNAISTVKEWWLITYWIDYSMIN